MTATNTRHHETLSAIAGNISRYLEEYPGDETIDDVVDRMHRNGLVSVEVIHGGEPDGWVTRHEFFPSPDDWAEIRRIAADAS